MKTRHQKRTNEESRTRFVDVIKLSPSQNVADHEGQAQQQNLEQDRQRREHFGLYWLGIHDRSSIADRVQRRGRRGEAGKGAGGVGRAGGCAVISKSTKICPICVVSHCGARRASGATRVRRSVAKDRKSLPHCTGVEF